MPAFYKEWFYRAKLSLIGYKLGQPQPKPALFVGPGSAGQLSKAIGQFGIDKVLVVTDKPLVELGLVAPLLQSLTDAGVQHSVYDGVLPDPTAGVVNNGIAHLKRESCNAVLAFGGGSSIDCAKVIALAAANDCAAEDCVGAGKCKEPALPFFAVPTTAGTGSEGTCIAVISDDETHDKSGVIEPSMIPKAAALDPEVMQGMPRHITAATGMDALTHAIESYIGTFESPETNFYGLASAKLIFGNLAEACNNPGNLEAREAMGLASYYGGLAITTALVGYVHAISHNMGARYGVPHGLGNALVLPHVLERLKGVSAPKMAEIARHCGMGNSGDSDEALAQILIDHVWTLNAEIGIPKTTDVIPEGDIDELTDVSLAEGSGYPVPRFFEREECRALVASLRSA